MTWVKIDSDLVRHRKVLAIPAADRAGALAMFVGALSYCQELLTDGRISRSVLLGIGEELGLKRPEKVAERLVKSGLFERPERGVFVVHDYLEHQQSRAEVLAKRERERQKKKAQRQEGSQTTLAVPLDVPKGHIGGQKGGRPQGTNEGTRAGARAPRTSSSTTKREDQSTRAGEPSTADDIDFTAAAPLPIEAPREAHIRLAVDQLGGDPGSQGVVEPLARQVTAAIFDELAERARTRPAGKQIGFLVSQLQHAIAQAGHDLEQAQRTNGASPSRYIPAQPPEDLDAWVAYETDPRRRDPWKPDEIANALTTWQINDDERERLLEKAAA